MTRGEECVLVAVKVSEVMRLPSWYTKEEAMSAAFFGVLRGIRKWSSYRKSATISRRDFLLIAAEWAVKDEMKAIRRRRIRERSVHDIQGFEV